MRMNSEAGARQINESAAQTPDLLSVKHFEPHVGEVFRFKDTRHSLVLARVVTESENPYRAGERRPFTLIFSGPKEREALREGLYDCGVDDGLVFSLYVAPIHTPAPDRQEYQAVFN
jgi:hypothetical protein